MNDAYDIAAAGGKHAGFLRNARSMGARQVEKMARSLQAVIDVHLKKIENPELIVSDWRSRSPQYQDGLKAHWGKEIESHREQLNVVEGLKNERKR